MPKINGHELGELIRITVREELKRILPTLIAEALAERYLRKVMAEAVPVRQPEKRVVQEKQKPRNLRELMQNDQEWEEETPEPLENEHQGIYHQSPLVRGKASQQNEGRRLDPEARQRALRMVYDEDPETVLQDPRLAQQEAAQKLASGNPALQGIFEDVRPVPGASAQSGGNVSLGETQQQFGEEGVPLDFLGKLGVNFDSVKRNVEGNVPPAARERVDEEYAARLAKKWGKPTG